MQIQVFHLPLMTMSSISETLKSHLCLQKVCFHLPLHIPQSIFLVQDSIENMQTSLKLCDLFSVWILLFWCPQRRKLFPCWGKVESYLTCKTLEVLSLTHFHSVSTSAWPCYNLNQNWKKKKKKKTSNMCLTFRPKECHCFYLIWQIFPTDFLGLNRAIFLGFTILSSLIKGVDLVRHHISCCCFYFYFSHILVFMSFCTKFTCFHKT